MDLTKSDKKHAINKIKAEIKNQPTKEGFSNDLMEYLSLPEETKKAMKEQHFAKYGKKIKATETKKIEKNTDTKETEEKSEDLKPIMDMLFAALKKTIDGAKTANIYLFKLARRFGLLRDLEDGIHKIIITKEDRNGIECTVISENGNKKIKEISNSQIMNTRDKNDTLFKDAVGREPRSFLEEFKYKDSCIVKITGQKRELIYPQNLLKEINGYVNQGRGVGTFNTKRIDNIIGFLTEGTNEHAQGFMKEIKTVAKKEYKNPTGERTEGLSRNQEELRNLITTFFSNPDIPIYIHKGKDIDNQAALFLLKKCPVYNQKRQVMAIEQGEEKNINRGIFLDIGKTTNGVKVEGEKLTLSEHREHTEEANLTDRTNSTTLMLYKILREVKFLPQEELDQLKRFVTFVDKVDGFNYQISGIDYQNSYRTMIGLHKTLAENREIGSIYRYFQNPANTGFERLSDDYLQKRKVKNRKGKIITLKEISEDKKIDIDNNIKKFKALQEQGYTLRYKGMPFIVDIKEKREESLKEGPKISGANKDKEGRQYGFFTIYPERGNVYIYSPQEFPPEVAGFPTEGHFLTIQNPSAEDLDRLFKEFDLGFKSKEGLKEEIKEYNKRAQEKKAADALVSIAKKEANAGKPNKKQEGENKLQEALDELVASERLENEKTLEKAIETGTSISGIVSNMKEGLGIFIQLGKNYANGKQGIGGLLHINKIEPNEALRNEALRKFKKLQKIEVFVTRKRPDGRYDFTLTKPDIKKS